MKALGVFSFFLDWIFGLCGNRSSGGGCKGTGELTSRNGAVQSGMQSLQKKGCSRPGATKVLRSHGRPRGWETGLPAWFFRTGGSSPWAAVKEWKN